MTSKKQETGIAVRSELKETYDAINKKLGGLKEIEESVFKTSGPISVGGASLDIQKCTNIRDLISFAGSLILREKMYNDAAKALKISEYPLFKAGGFSLEHILQDIKLRYDIINIKETKDTLEKASNELSQFFSEEQKMSEILDKIKNNLNI